MSVLNRLHGAMLELVSSAPIKQRLMAAFSRHLQDLDPAELPPELRAPFGELFAELQAVKPLRSESAIQATVRKMSADQADRYAVRIVTLYGDLARGPATVTRLVREKREESGAVVPLLFAAEA